MPDRVRHDKLGIIEGYKNLITQISCPTKLAADEVSD
jgi:hypothetical protein